MNKFRQGKIKREHSIIPGLLPLLEAAALCPQVQSVIPGPIASGPSPAGPSLTFQYFTDTGCKLLGKNGDAVQEVYLVTDQREATKRWLQDEGLIAPDPPPPPAPRARVAALAQEVLQQETTCAVCGRPILPGARAARTGPPKKPAYAHVRCARR